MVGGSWVGYCKLDYFFQIVQLWFPHFIHRWKAFLMPPQKIPISSICLVLESHIKFGGFYNVMEAFF